MRWKSGHSDEFRVKSHLCHEIASIVEARKLTQVAAAEITGQKALMDEQERMEHAPGMNP